VILKLVKRAIVKRKENGARLATSRQYGPEVSNFFYYWGTDRKKRNQEKEEQAGTNPGSLLL